MDAAGRNSVGKDGEVGQTRAPGRAMSRIAKSFALLLSFAGLLLGAADANALACTSVATGNWGVAGTWTSAGNCNRVPTVADSVTIATGHTVTVNVATANVQSITVNTGAILTQTLALSTAGALNVAGTLTSNNAMTVTGATTVTGNLNIVGAGARTFTGLVTVTGGTWNNSGNRAVTFRGGITNNGTFTAGTGTQTFNLAQAIGGANPINFGGIVAVVGAVTVTNNNTGGVTIAGNLTGSAAGSTWVNAANSTLNYGGALAPMGTRVFTASAVPNTVNYNGAAAQAVKTANYNNLTVTKPAGIAATTAAGTVNVTGALTVTSGRLNIAGTTVAVTGATSVSGTLGITSATGTKTFTGLVTVNPGGTWTNTTEAVTFRGGITNNGTFTGGTGTQTFDITPSQIIAGSSPINFGGIVAVTGAVTVTNNNTSAVSITGNLTGSAVGSTWVNGINSTLNYGGAAAPMGTRVFTASTVPNTVNYNRSGAQPIKTPTANTYHHLQLTSVAAGAKTAAVGLTVNGDFTLSGAASFTASTFTHNFAGNWIVNTTAAAPLSVTTTSIINFNTPAIPAPTSVGGTTAATLAFADVNINNTSGVTFNENASFQTGTTPTLTVAAGATLTPAAAVVISGTTGTLTGSGTVQVTRTTAGTANFSSQYTIATKTLANLTVDYAGAAAQTVSVLTYGSATGGGLKVSNASGVSLTANTTVAGTLTLTSGAVSTGAFTLIVSKACNAPSVVRSGGHVAGFLQKSIPVGAPVNCTFEVGDAATYRPIDTTFASVTTAGNLVGSVTQAAGEHPQCCGATPFGLDSAKDVNRYWTIANPGGIVFTTYSATFNFINPTDFDAGADPANFEVEFWNGAWNTTTFGTRTLTSTQAGGLGAFGDFAVGEKKPIVPGSFNAFETSTAAGAITGRIFTRLAGGAPSLDIVAISGGAQMNSFNKTVTVELLGNQAAGIPLDAQNCPTSFTLIQTVTPNPTITGGRSTVSFAAVANAWKDVRVRVRYPVASPTVTSCSTDNFSIRPTGFTVSSTNAGNTGTSGAPAIKTGAGFNLTAASVAGYNGTPAIDNTAVTGTPNAGTIGGAFAAAPPATGTAAGNAFFYSETGNFGLSANAVFDNTFTSVDQPNDCTADFSNTLAGGKYGCYFGSSAVPFVVGSSGFGRFIPDNFNVSYTPPLLAAACGTFGYVGQSFSYTIAPVITVTARNGTANGLTNATTLNYAGAYMKLTNASLAQAPYDTTAGRYSRFDALGGGLTPALDTSGLPPAASDPAIGTFTNGAGTLTFGAGTGLSFTRSITTPSAPFDADIALALNVADADGVAFAGNPASFGAPTAGNGIVFSGGKQMRYGRLKLANAHGSELLNLPVPIQTQSWNGTAFVTNTADNCTTLTTNNINLNPIVAGVSATVGGAFLSGVGSLILSRPTTPAKVGVNLCVDLGADPVGGTVCSATASANLPYLQGLWSPGASFNNDPGARATFGVYKGSNEFIYLREVY